MGIPADMCSVDERRLLVDTVECADRIRSFVGVTAGEPRNSSPRWSVISQLVRVR